MIYLCCFSITYKYSKKVFWQHRALVQNISVVFIRVFFTHEVKQKKNISEPIQTLTDLLVLTRKSIKTTDRNKLSVVTLDSTQIMKSVRRLKLTELIGKQMMVRS